MSWGSADGLLQGVFSGVFPVKCNHDCELIEGILEAGRPFNFGLEVGSKAELLMAMSKIGTSPGALLICNGYKDAAFMRLVCERLSLQRLQRRCLHALGMCERLSLQDQSDQMRQTGKVLTCKDAWQNSDTLLSMGFMKGRLA